MPTRLILVDHQLFPIQAFFNAVSDESFLNVIDHLTHGIGYSINDAHVHFPDDLDRHEETFDGVRFSLYEDRVIISRNELAGYLKTLATDFISHYPDKKYALEQLLGRL